MTREKGGQVDVELVEHEAPGHAATQRAGRPRRARRSRLVVVAAAVLAVGAVVATNVAQVRADAALRERLVGLPGVVAASLATPLEEAWSLEGAVPVTHHGEVLVVQDDDGRLQGLDAVTGRAVWMGPAAQEARRCEPLASLGGLGFLGGGTATGTDAVLCRNPGVDTLVTVLDVGSGRELARVRAPVALRAWERWDDVLLLRWDDDDRVHVLAWDLAAGAERWRWTSEAMTDVERDGFTTTWRPGGHVELSTWTAVGEDAVDARPLGRLDLATGELHEADDAPPFPTSSWGLADGWQVSVRARAEDGFPAVVLEDPAGQVVLERAGWPWSAQVDDRSVLPVLLVGGESGALEAVDPATGEVRWTRDDAFGAIGLVRLEGVLVLAETGDDGVTTQAVALDTRTGAERWRAPLGATGTGVVLIDGRRMGVVREGEDGQALVAVDLRSGEELWTWPLRRGQGVAAMAGQVVLTDGLRTAVLR